MASLLGARRLPPRLLALLALPLVATAAFACGNSDQLILATTTSTQDSGLLDVLVPLFQRESEYEVKTIAVGSGQALRMGREGEADVILAHSPADEQAFVDAGDGIERLRVMHNDFVVVGPGSDPAGIAGSPSAAEAFTRIARSRSLFIGRGDNSGTEAAEMRVWSEAGLSPEGQGWYQQTGQGMGATLAVANEKRGYTLSDRGTYLAQRDRLDLELLFEGDPELFNIYHVIVVNPEKHPAVNAEAARAFARFITGDAAQEAIGNFGVEEFGQPLFVPDARSGEP